MVGLVKNPGKLTHQLNKPSPSLDYCLSTILEFHSQRYAANAVFAQIISSHLFPPPSPIFAGGANDRWVRAVSFCPDGLHIASLTDDR